MKINLFIFSLCVFAPNMVSCIDNWGKDKPFIMDHIQNLQKGVRSNKEEITSFKQGIAIARKLTLQGWQRVKKIYIIILK